LVFGIFRGRPTAKVVGLFYAHKKPAFTFAAGRATTADHIDKTVTSHEKPLPRLARVAAVRPHEKNQLPLLSSGGDRGFLEKQIVSHAEQG